METAVEQQRETRTLFFTGGPMDGKQLRVPGANEIVPIQIYVDGQGFRQALYRVVWRDEWIAEYLEEDNGDADVG